MDAILMSLMTALNEHLLINVYQRDTDDFYTGYVQVLGHDAVVLDCRWMCLDRIFCD